MSMCVSELGRERERENKEKKNKSPIKETEKETWDHQSDMIISSTNLHSLSFRYYLSFDHILFRVQLLLLSLHPLWFLFIFWKFKERKLDNKLTDKLLKII